jgi:hypothetical protein
MKPNDLAFDPTEALYRTVAKEQLHPKTGKVKPNALRPQFSVVRSAHVGTAENVPARNKFNGVAQITVAQVRSIRGSHITPHCVYEPLKEDESHSLIALVTEVAAGTSLDEDFEKVRAAIANAMTVPRLPQ